MRLSKPVLRPYPSRSAQGALESACGKTRGIIEGVACWTRACAIQCPFIQAGDSAYGGIAFSGLVACPAPAGLFFGLISRLIAWRSPWLV